MQTILSPTPYVRALPQPRLGRPWTPEGQLLLREALHQFGQKKLPKWTGEELQARHGIFGPPQPPREPESGEPLRKMRANRDEVEIIRNPVRYIVGNALRIISFDEALERYEAEKDELYDLWQKETAAFQRYLEAMGQFRQALHAGHVPATILTGSGHSHDVPGHLWSGNDAAKIFETGRAKIHVGDPYFGSTVEGMVLIGEESLNDHLHPSSPTDSPEPANPPVGGTPPATDATPAPASVKPSGAGGRPAKWDWEACWLEICRRVHEEGLPETRAELVRHLLDWFAEKHGDTPSESQIKQRVTLVFRALREAENS